MSDNEAPTTTTTTTKTSVHANTELRVELFRIGRLALDCLFDIHSETCSVPHDEVSTEDIVQAMNALYGCNWDFANGICRGMTTEEFQELLDKLTCPEGWTFVDGWICDPEEWHES